MKKKDVLDRIGKQTDFMNFWIFNPVNTML